MKKMECGNPPFVTFKKRNNLAKWNYFNDRKIGKAYIVIVQSNIKAGQGYP
jgi:hypothetical protein